MAVPPSAHGPHVWLAHYSRPGYKAGLRVGDVLLTVDGQFLRMFGGAGPGERGDGERAGEFRLPRGVAVDPSGQKLFVAEQKRVQVLTTQWGVPLQVLPMPGAGTLWGICVSERYAHVVDNFKQTVTVLELCNTGVAW